MPSISKIFETEIYTQISTYIDKFLSPFLCGFRKGFSTQHCLMRFISLWQKSMDNGILGSALLTDLSKAFDCLNHELLIAKLEAYGFSNSALHYIYNYLSNRKQRVKVNNSFSEWCNILFGVPQGSILGPLLFNIYINDIFMSLEKCEIANFADDSTPFCFNSSIESLVKDIELDANILVQWFQENYLKLNTDKCHLLISNHDESVFVNVGNDAIQCNKTVKLLGILIDNKLDFSEHISKLCKIANQKLHALARISHLMSKEKLRIILKAFIESQFGYCPLVWMFHSRTLNNRINKIHERALRIIYRDPSLTFQELLQKDKSVSIHHRNLQKLAIEMYKINNDLSPTFMREIFLSSNTSYNLRNKNPFRSISAKTVSHGTETLSFRGPKTWAMVPLEIKNSLSLDEFKFKIRKWEPRECPCRLCRVYISKIGFIN